MAANEVAHLTPGSLNPQANAWQPSAGSSSQAAAGSQGHTTSSAPKGDRNRTRPPRRKGRGGNKPEGTVNDGVNLAQDSAGSADQAGPSSQRNRKPAAAGRGGDGRNDASRRERQGNAQNGRQPQGASSKVPSSTPSEFANGGAAAAPTSEPAQSSRKSRFGMKLTTTSEPAAPISQDKTATGTFPLQDDYSDLRSRLIAELSHGKYDCVICYSTVTTRQSIWSCSQCSAVLHLGCAKQWAERSVKQMEEQNAMQEDPEIRARRGTWRYPGCQYAREDVPQKYWCWCGKVMDPNPQNSPSGRRIPHGCGQTCSKGHCSHGCSELCHPASCPPCPVTVSRKCFCGKKVIAIRCSQLTKTTRGLKLLSTAGKEMNGGLDETQMQGISCSDACEKMLNCGVHSCQSTCHAGKCADCTVEKVRRCYCGKHEKSMLCGYGDERVSSGPDGAETWKGHWKCDEPCQKKFDCGVHSCQKPCHPLSAGSATCPRSPSFVKTCPCGATPITDRTSCQDPILTCKETCNKFLPCGHTCADKCHEGECKPCRVPITLPCRCGETKQTRSCSDHETGADGDKEILCKTVCKALRNCGKHQCNKLCCPLYFQAKSKSKKRLTPAELELQDPAGFHACDVPCGKLLSCKQHTCERGCHRGACGRCLQSSFEEMVCHCGRTVLEPPVQCGTQIQCNFPCTRPPPPCGHPEMPHNCHEEEQCPPCVYLTERLCHCKKTVVPNVPCSRANVHCGVTCNAVLGCGFHRCQGVCHQAPGDCAPCTQLCGKPRKLCGHACTATCHAPTACPESEPCPAITALQCACGNLQQKVKCSASIHNPRTERMLKCNDTCIIAQRNAKMAEALGLNMAEKAAPTQYPESVLQFYASKRKDAESIEQALTELIQSPRHGSIMPSAKQDARKFTHELAEVFGLLSESVDEEPQRSVMLRRTGNSRVPNRSLKDAWQERALENSLNGNGMLRKAPPSVTLTQMRKAPSTSASPSTAPAWNGLILEGVFGYDEQSIRAALAPVLNAVSYSAKWISHEDVLLYPSSRGASSTQAMEMASRPLLSRLASLRSLCKDAQVAREVLPAIADLTHLSVTMKGKPTDIISANGSIAQPTPSAWSSSRLTSSAVRSAPTSGRATPTSGAGPGASGSGSGGWAAIVASRTAASANPQSAANPPPSTSQPFASGFSAGLKAWTDNSSYPAGAGSNGAIGSSSNPSSRTASPRMPTASLLRVPPATSSAASVRTTEREDEYEDVPDDWDDSRDAL